MLDPPDVQPLMALMTAAIYCAPIILVPMFDRYLVPLAPLLAYWLLATGRAAWTTALAPALSALVCAVLVVYSVLPRARLPGVESRTLEGTGGVSNDRAADFRSIDGSYEYGSLRGSNEPLRRYQPLNWWGMPDDAYVVSFGRIEGYEPVKRYEYLHTLLPGLGTDTCFAVRPQARRREPCGAAVPGETDRETPDDSPRALP